MFAAIDEAYKPIVEKIKPIYPDYSDNTDSTIQNVPFDPLGTDYSGVLDSGDLEYQYNSVDQAFNDNIVKNIPKGFSGGNREGFSGGNGGSREGFSGGAPGPGLDLSNNDHS